MTTNVTYSISYKRNVGNYESATAFFSITDTVRDNETVDITKDRIVGKVDSWLEDKIREIDNDVKV